MIKTAVCDDEKFFVEELHILIKNFFLNNRIDFRVSEYMSGKVLAEHAHDFDLIASFRRKYDGILRKNIRA